MPHPPFQFTLGELSSMLTIYDNKGDGRSTANHWKYFWSDNPRDDNQVQPFMTTLHHYKENKFLLSTIYEIKKIVPKKNHRKFWIKCLMKNYKWGNDAIRKRHKTLSKDTVYHQYNFTASYELLMTLPYQFFGLLKSEVWQKLPSPWLNLIQRKNRNAQNNSIQRIWVIRLLCTKGVLPGNDMVNHLPAINERYIYKIYMDKSRCCVNYGQISNIIGDKPWMKSEVHCLCNLSSHRILMLTLDSKRKPITNKGELCGAGNNIKQIEIGDMVTVSNHGNLFPLAIVKKINSLDKTAKSNGTFHLRQTLLNYAI